MSMVLTPPEETTTRPAASWCDAPPVTDANAGLPDWYLDLRSAAWARYGALPVPTRTNQHWRFADLKHLTIEGHTPAAPVSASVAADLIARAVSERPAEYAAHFVFANNRLLHAETPALPAGATCLPVTEALLSHSDLLREHFLKHGDFLGGEKFAALHAAATLSGLFVHFPKGAVAEHPVIVHHFVGGEGVAVFPHTLVVSEDHASVTVLDLFESVDGNEDSLIVGMADLHAARGGRIQYAAMQDLSDKGAKHVQLQHTRAGRDASVKVGFLNLGAEWVRNESINRMVENGADCQIFSANLANDVQEYDQRTLQSHEAQHTTSDLFFKNALYDRARTIFSGLIQVQPGSHHTDSYQTCRNLMGSDEAEANSMPGLEIDADQVKCSHGSTSGTISDEEIFYLRARGIPAEDARKMISLGFLNESINRLDGDGLKEILFARVERKFAAIV
jgi:Fe-S cluster assembly protein SufD